MGSCNTKKRSVDGDNNSSIIQSSQIKENVSDQSYSTQIQQIAKKPSKFNGFCMGSKQRLRKNPYLNDGSMGDMSMDETLLKQQINLDKSSSNSNNNNSQAPIQVTLNYQIIEKTKIQNQHFHNNSTQQQQSRHQNNNNRSGNKNSGFHNIPDNNFTNFENNDLDNSNNGGFMMSSPQHLYNQHHMWFNQNQEEMTVAQILMSKYEYYSDIDPHSPDAHLHLMIIEREKRLHHTSMLTILQYLQLNEIILIGRINRKLYIVSGDISLLRNYTKKQSQTLPASYKQLQQGARLQKMILRQSLELQKLLIKQQLWESQINNLNYVYQITDTVNTNNLQPHLHNIQQESIQEESGHKNKNKLDSSLIQKGEINLQGNERNTALGLDNNYLNIQEDGGNDQNHLNQDSQAVLLDAKQQQAALRNHSHQKQLQSDNNLINLNGGLKVHSGNKDTNTALQSNQDQLQVNKTNNTTLGVYDIILDKNCSKIELQNQIFLIRNNNEYYMPHFQYDENNQNYKLGSFQSQQSIGSIHQINDDEDNSKAQKQENKQTKLEMKKKQINHLLIKDFSERDQELDSQYNDSNGQTSQQNVFLKTKKLEFGQMQSPESKKSGSQIKFQIENNPSTFKRLQTQEQPSLKSSQNLHNSLQHRREGYYKHPKLSQESINYVQNQGYSFFKRINLENINKNQVLSQAGIESSRFGSHILQSAEGGYNGNNDIRVSNLSHRTPSFINRMRESSVRMMMSNQNILSNRNSHIIFQSEDSDHIYGQAGVSGLQSNRQGYESSKISHLNTLNTHSNNNYKAQNTNANHETLNTNSNGVLFGQIQGLKNNNTLNVAQKNININLSHQHSIGSHRSVGNKLSQRGNSNQNINANTDYVNIKLGHNTVVLLQAPDGTTATIMPRNAKNSVHDSLQQQQQIIMRQQSTPKKQVQSNSTPSSYSKQSTKNFKKTTVTIEDQQQNNDQNFQKEESLISNNGKRESFNNLESIVPIQNQ
eukprot:403342384